MFALVEYRKGWFHKRFWLLSGFSEWRGIAFSSHAGAVAWGLAGTLLRKQVPEEDVVS